MAERHASPANGETIAQMAATLLAGEMAGGKALEAIAPESRVKKAIEIALRLFNETHDAIRAQPR